MNASDEFHTEEVVFSIGLWANVVAWLALALSLLVFANTAYSIASNWASVSQTLPPTAFGKISAFANLFLDPLTGGVFVFLVLRGLSQLLYLGLDLYYRDNEEDEEEDIIAFPADTQDTPEA